MPTTYYDTLQVAPNANPAVIRASYRALSQQYHPDRNPDDLERANRYMKRINEAYEVLSDPARRARYDEIIADARDAERTNDAASENVHPSTPPDSDRAAKHAPDPLAERMQQEARSRFEKRASAAGAATMPAKRTSSWSSEWIGNFGFGFLLVGPLTALLIFAVMGSKLSADGFWVLLGISSVVAGLLWAWRRKDGTLALSQKAADREPPSYQLSTLLGCGIVAAIVTARRLPMPTELSNKSWVSSLFDPFFLGLLVIPAIAFGLSVLIPYGLGYALTKSKRAAWYSGAGVTLLVFGVFWAGAEAQIQQRQQLDAKAVEHRNQPTTASVLPTTVAPTRAIDARKEAYDAAVRDLEARYPSLNPDSRAFDEAFTRRVLDRARELTAAGKEPAVAVRQAAVEASEGVAPAPLENHQPRSSVTSAPSDLYASGLSAGEQTAIHMRCADFQLSGQVRQYRDCITAGIQEAKAGPGMPSVSHLPVGEQTAVHMACGDYQMQGDVRAYQQCMREQLAKLR
jgi:hypothetical protein